MCFSRNSVGVSGHCDFRDIQKSIFSCVYWAIASYCLQSPLYCRGGELRNHNSLVCWCVFTLTNVTFFIQVRSAPIILQLEQRLPSRLLTKKKTDNLFKCTRRKLTETISSLSETSFTLTWWDREAIQHLVFEFGSSSFVCPIRWW